MDIKGIYYDGKTSRAVEAVLAWDQGHVTVTPLEGGAPVLAQADHGVRISPRIGQTPQYINFSGGEKFETSDHQGVAALKKAMGGTGLPDRIHLLESRLTYAALALVFLLAAMWWGGTWGVPLASEFIAHRLPVQILDQAGDQTLAALDRHLLTPSTLDPALQERLLGRFQPLVEGRTQRPIRIIFRHGDPVGANAFALPNGVILFTDQMVTLAEHEDELVSVLFHETGHLVHRHGLRTLIQNSLVGFALLALTGDASGSAELFMGLPVFLTQMAYSRGFEFEADQYALAAMDKTGIPRHRFSDLMERLVAMEKKPQAQTDEGWSNYLSTHPLMSERLKPFKE